MNKAILTVRGIREMHHATRKRMIEWLRRQADELEADPKAYAETYQAKFK